MCSAVVVVLSLLFPYTVRAAFAPDAEQKTFRDPVQVSLQAQRGGGGSTGLQMAVAELQAGPKGWAEQD